MYSRYLQDNNLTTVNNRAFKGLEDSVTYIDLSNCSIEDLGGTPFDDLLMLDTLVLQNNKLTNESLKKSLKGHETLSVLLLSGNHFTTVPNMPVSAFPHLKELYISHNDITAVTRKDLRDMTQLKKLHLNENPLWGFSEDDDTFADCPDLDLLNLDYTYVSQLPNMTYLPNLRFLHADHAQISHIPANLCCSCSNLLVLEMQGNLLTDIPMLACRELTDFDLGHNRIRTVHKDLLKDMPHIRDLSLRENQIEELDFDFFVNSENMEILQISGNHLPFLPRLTFMPHLFRLNASHNHIRKINDNAFLEQGKLAELYLNDNDIDYISPRAFHQQNQLLVFNLSRNGRLKEWVLPSSGFQHLLILYLQDMFELHQVPHVFEIPLARELYLTYSYHCCIWDRFPGILQINVTQDEGSGSLIVTQPTVPTTTSVSRAERIRICNDGTPGIIPMHIIEFYIAGGVKFIVTKDCIIEIVTDFSNATKTINIPIDANMPIQQMIQAVSRTGINIADFPVLYRQKVVCTPHENPLTPCEYLLDPWVLRVAIWIVWVITLLGNGIVLFIGIAAREKLESNELLICILAFADFCLGVYLAFLAVVDIRTFGTSFFQSALDWQLGPGCKTAGFVAIFSSELSIYILVILTLERVYTISNAFNHNERTKRRVTIILCILGLVLAAVLALLPLVGVNSYSRVAVCLPYLTESLTDRFYIGFILTINFAGFLIILFSYLYIFWVACRNAPASNMAQRRKDTLMAACKIAFVIVTAFLCWAPIAVIGYLALVNIHLVDAKEAKYFIVFVYPLNACINPLIYAFFTKRFRDKITSIFRRSKDRVTSFPPNSHMRLQRNQTAFSSEYPMKKISSGSSCPDELLQLRQSRRSNSLVVQMVDTSLNTPSPTFHPPNGCNLGRRASLPPGFGSTLNMAGTAGEDQPCSTLPHYSIPFPLRLGSNSSLPNLQEESDMDLENDVIFSDASGGEQRPNPLTSSQESNLRRLSVVKEENEVDLAVNVCANEDEDSKYERFSLSSSDEYSDASDGIEHSCVEGGTDLDDLIRSGGVSVVRGGEGVSAASLRQNSSGEEPRVEEHNRRRTEVMDGSERRKTSDSSSSFGDVTMDMASRSKARSCENIYTTSNKLSDVTSPLSNQPSAMNDGLEQVLMSRSLDNLHSEQSEDFYAQVPSSQFHPSNDISSDPSQASMVNVSVEPNTDTQHCNTPNSGLDTTESQYHHSSTATSSHCPISHSNVNPLSTHLLHATPCQTSNANKDTSQASNTLHLSKCTIVSKDSRETDV